MAKSSHTAQKANKVECLNPNSGGRMNIEKDIYDLFHKSIRKVLQGGKMLSFTELTEAIEDHFEKNKIGFKKSLPWYAISVKNDMEARGVIEVVVEKGKKLNRLKK